MKAANIFVTTVKKIRQNIIKHIYPAIPLWLILEKNPLILSPNYIAYNVILVL